MLRISIIIGCVLVLILAAWANTGCTGIDSRLNVAGTKKDKVNTQVGLVNFADLETIEEHTNGLKTKIENTRAMLWNWFVKFAIFSLLYYEGRKFIRWQGSKFVQKRRENRNT